jgi:hypothetical protein
MSFQAWAASWSAYTVATSGRIAPSSSSRAILPSPSADGASLIIAPDTLCDVRQFENDEIPGRAALVARLTARAE